jgi:CRP/FNR family transcriptional regulator, anaerobic regulatory protein
MDTFKYRNAFVGFFCEAMTGSRGSGLKHVHTSFALQHQTCQSCPARHHAVCRALNGTSIHRLGDVMVHRHIARGELVWHEADDIRQFSIIVSGVVKLVIVLPDGRQQIVGLLFPSDCLGRPFSHAARTAAEAVTDVELCSFGSGQFERVMSENPEIEHALLERTLDNLDDARMWMATLGRKTAREKIAGFLLQMSRRADFDHCPDFKSGSNFPTVSIPLTRAEIADYLGLTIETVSRKLSKFRADGLIHLVDSRTIEICDPESLKDAAESGQ